MAGEKTFWRWLGVALLATSPAVLAFALLAGFGLLPAWVAALSALGVATVFGSLVLGSVDKLTRYANAVLKHMQDRTEALPQPPLPWIGEPIGETLKFIARTHDDAVRRLSTSLSDLEHALEALPTPILLVSAERVIVRVNRAAGEMLGSGLKGRGLAAVLRNANFLAAVETAVDSGIGLDLEFSLPLPVERSFLAHIEPLPEAAADGSKLVLALVDQTAARRTDQMRADFVANASHEIRTPLATLIGFIETLQGPARDDPTARDRFLVIMAQNADRMAGLVDDLLSLSKIEINEHAPPIGRIDLAAVAQSAANNLAWQAKNRRVTLQIERSTAAVFVVGDDSELTLALQNLIGNAIKYGRDGGRVGIRLAHVASAPGSVGWRLSELGAVALSVSDEGEGIAREHLPRLTERFYRVDTARSRELGGTGLGLAIVKHIMNRHRGALGIESVLGKGSTFTLYLEPVEPPFPE
ncbi:MAG: PAS domain-containing sensor histidine kinase [Alphaproteobacteria bacterium]|nr:PAS domain-containing sensor histidine kinase [Alphaproteobacteria bacterium]